ncbi:hypothetical protein ACFSTC_22660 [Nonomuraea ferruginea]
MLITLLLPTVLTIGFSLRSGGLVGPSAFAGLGNYGRAVRRRLVLARRSASPCR